MKKYLKLLVLVLCIITCLFMMCACSNDAKEEEQNVDVAPKKTIKLTEENVDEYIYYTMIVTPVDGYYRYENENGNSNTRYYAYIVEVGVFPRVKNVVFDDVVVTIGQKVNLKNGDIIYKTNDYTFPVYLDEKGYGEYKDQVFLPQGDHMYEYKSFTRKYFEIKGNILIY